VPVRSSKYSNNITKQDHRALMGCFAPTLGFDLFEFPSTTIARIK
jgi:hypothetical protein